MPPMPKIRFLPMETEVEVAEGTTILDAALDHNVPLNHNCGGNCACSTCHVVVEQGYESLGESLGRRGRDDRGGDRTDRLFPSRLPVPGQPGSGSAHSRTGQVLDRINGFLRKT